MITKQNNEIFSTEEKYVHIKNTIPISNGDLLLVCQ